MKKTFPTLLGVTVFVMAALAFYYFEDAKRTNVVPASQRGTAPVSPSTARPDGAFDYKSNLAIAASKIDEQNPLRFYTPTPGLEGRMKLDEIAINGAPVTAQSVSIARALLKSGTLSPDEKIPMVRILASLHNRENTTGANNDIALDLKRSQPILTSNSGQEFNAASFLKSSEDMAELLRVTEPKFSPTVGLGLGDAVRYTEWLRASATIESHKSGRGMDEVIVSRFIEPGVDPRAVMSYLLSPLAGPLLAAAAPDSQVQELVYIAERYSRHLPGDPNMRALMQEIRGRMKNPPPAMPMPVFTPPTGPLMPHGVAPPGMTFTTKPGIPR